MKKKKHPIGCFSFWLREADLNHRPSGYEPDELPDCSIPRYFRVPYYYIRITLHCQPIIFKNRSTRFLRTLFGNFFHFAVVVFIDINPQNWYTFRWLFKLVKRGAFYGKHSQGHS